MGGGAGGEAGEDLSGEPRPAGQGEMSRTPDCSWNSPGVGKVLQRPRRRKRPRGFGGH